MSALQEMNNTITIFIKERTLSAKTKKRAGKQENGGL